MSVISAHPVASIHSPDAKDSAATSINGSTSTNETANTEISSTNESAAQEAPVSHKPAAAAPPRLNPWKLRAEQNSGRALPPNDTPSEKEGDTANGKGQGSLPVASHPAAQPQAEATPAPLSPFLQKKTHKPTKSLAPSIDDAALWPSLDMALEERNDQKRGGNGDQTDHNTALRAPKVTGKEKWTKLTPTITYTPIPSSKSARTNGPTATGAKISRGAAGPRTGGREKSNENGEHVTADASSKVSRSLDTSRPRPSKTRSMSVSNARPDGAAPVRRDSRHSREGESHENATSLRSHSSKRSDRGSISAPPGSNSQTANGAGASQSSTSGGSGPDQGPTNFAEHRAQRSSYDSAFASRGRGGGYRNSNTRGNYQASYSNRYQNPAFIQPNYQSGPARSYGQREQNNPYVYDQFQNFLNPSIAPMMMDPMLARQMVLNQCEYYFSIENLCKDLFLRKHMDDEGFVNLPILANFNRVRAITMDYALIRDVCFVSNVIELRAAAGSYDKIRRAEGWEHWVLPADQRDASTRDVPVVAEVQSSTPTNASGDETPDMNIAARSFVPGQQIADSQAPTTNLNENFGNLGLGNSVVPDVEERKEGKSYDSSHEAAAVNVEAES